jgi:hypothetical protein
VELLLLADGSSQAGLLEEIGPESAGLSVETPLQPGDLLLIRAQEMEMPARADFCARRETDFFVEVRFTNGYRWDPARWKPDHLYLPPEPTPARREWKHAAGKQSRRG